MYNAVEKNVRNIQFLKSTSENTMVLILDGISEIVAHVRSNQNSGFLLYKEPIFLHAVAICTRLPSGVWFIPNYLIVCVIVKYILRYLS